MNRIRGRYQRGFALAQSDGVHQKLLHVGGERVEEQRAAHGQPDDDEHFARVFQQQRELTGLRGGGLVLERIGLDQIPAQIQRRRPRRSHR